MQVIAAADAENVRISKVLTTHKHMDHAGGNGAITDMIPGIEIIGGDRERVQSCTSSVQDNEMISVGSISVKCLHTPG